MTKRVIFVCGADHSGSTLIGAILGANNDGSQAYFHAGECHAFFSPNHARYGQLSRVPEDFPYLWNYADPAAGPEGAFDEMFRISGAHTIIDSSKKLSWVTSQIEICETKGWDIALVVSYRPFLKIVKSFRSREKTEDVIDARLSYYRAMLDQIPNHLLDGLVAIHVDRLCAAPQEQTRAMCDRLDVPYFEGKELYWNFPLHHIFGARTQRMHLLRPETADYQVSGPLPSDEASDYESHLDQIGLLDVERRILEFCI